ncbi:hypothetical protein TNCV_4995601 [Trichonephila clavipes]|nr:hypothetical protein TNCV_4995601 [Trichonephila clavipes]
MSEEAIVDLKQEQSERAFLREKYLRILSKLENNVAEIEMPNDLHVTACVRSFHPDGTKDLRIKRCIFNTCVPTKPGSDCSSLVVKITTRGWNVISLSLVQLKTHHVRDQCMLNLLRAQMSFCWCGVEARRGGCQLSCHPCHLTMVQNCEVRHQKPSSR